MMQLVIGQIAVSLALSLAIGAAELVYLQRR